MTEQLAMPLETQEEPDSESHGVCNGIKITCSPDWTCKVILDYGTPVVVLTLEGKANHSSVAAYEVNRLIRKSLKKEPLPPLKPITIEVRGGVVQEVVNLPTGYGYKIVDYDDLEATETTVQ